MASPLLCKMTALPAHNELAPSLCALSLDHVAAALWVVEELQQAIADMSSVSRLHVVPVCRFERGVLNDACQ